VRALESIIAALVLTSMYARAQETSTHAAPATNAAPDALETEDEKKWAFSVSAYTYFVREGDDYVQPTITADRGWLHLEARYQYENLDTGSAWVGYNFSGGKKLAWEFTPMVGGVFGDTSGVAPGYKGSLGWWKLELYSEGEYVFDSEAHSDSFFYTWSELSLRPVEWFRFGFVTQRTRAYESNVDIQRGMLVGFTCKKIDLGAYVFNLEESKPTLVMSVALNF
jgi:hypothetical protein